MDQAFHEQVARRQEWEESHPEPHPDAEFIAALLVKFPQLLATWPGRELNDDRS